MQNLFIKEHNQYLPDKDKIHETYFITIFNKLVYRKMKELKKQKRIGNYEDFEDELNLLIGHCPSKEDINILDEALLETCAEYLTLSQSNLTEVPNNISEFVSIILKNMTENLYKESFLFSLNLIFNEYFFYCGKGNPTSWTDLGSTQTSILEVTTNSKNEVISFEGIGLDEIERCELINKMLMMERKNQIGPLPKVRQKIRKDI